jgi:hypothetical protein
MAPRRKQARDRDETLCDVGQKDCDGISALNAEGFEHVAKPADLVQQQLVRERNRSSVFAFPDERQTASVAAANVAIQKIDARIS